MTFRKKSIKMQKKIKKIEFFLKKVLTLYFFVILYLQFENTNKKGEKIMETIELNHDKLKGKIREVLGTQCKLANMIGLDEATISNKINSNTYFTQKEILKISEILNIRLEEIPEYFFKLKVREHE
jgi:hypothetical protein